MELTNGKSEGGYVFVSHAHKDIHEIRKIRNILEENGLEPICFYLRCLNDNDEILDLIKREIDAREWFLLVDSKNARESNWVKTEVEYIKSKDSKKMISVSLDNQEDIIPVLSRLSNSMRVFLSYSHKDRYIAQAIYSGCLKHDFKVFYDLESIRVGNDWTVSSTNALEEAAKHGCVVIIISENSVNSDFVVRELNLAVSQKAYILPIIVDDFKLPAQFMFHLSTFQKYHLKTPVSVKQVEEIVALIEKISIQRLGRYG